MKKLVICGLLLLALLAWLSSTVVTYHATCASCLAQARGREVSVFGLVISSRLNVGHNADYPQLPEDGPELYKRIFGRECPHYFKRGGMGRSSFGMIGCGSFPEERAFAPRIQAVTALLNLVRRLPETGLAHASYECIDQNLAADATLRDALSYTQYLEKPNVLQRLAQMFDLVANEDEWRRAIAFAQGGSDDVLNDIDILTDRKGDPRPEVHRTASLRLMELEYPGRWGHVAECLSDKDREIVRRAVSIIESEHHLELYGKMLRMPHEYFYREVFVANVRDEDIAGLLDSDDDVVAAFCDDAISTQNRMQFLQPLLQSLNQRFSEIRLKAIRSLLDGPKVFDRKTDPWPDIKAFDGSTEEATSIVSLGTASEVRDVRKHLFLNACKALAVTKDKRHWPLLHDTYIESVSQFGLNQMYAAVMAQAMFALKPEKTEAVLLNELRLGDSEYQRQACALAAMGLLAKSAFLEPVQAFKAHLPAKSNGTNSQHIFHNPYYGKYLDYALHRCAGVHLQEVRKDAGGVYVIEPSR